MTRNGRKANAGSLRRFAKPLDTQKVFRGFNSHSFRQLELWENGSQVAWKAIRSRKWARFDSVWFRQHKKRMYIMRIPLPRNTDISLIKHLRGNFEFYKKELAKNPDYGKKRAQRDKKRGKFFEKDQ